MRTPFIATLLSLSLAAVAAPKSRPRAVAAKPAVPATPSDQKPASQIISSDLGGKDMLFVAHAIDLGKALRYLGTQTPRTSNPALRGFGDDVVKTLTAQSAVLTTVADMREVKATDFPSPTEQRITEKISKLEGVKLEKAILDAFIEIDRRLIAAYELGAQSSDVTIRQFVDQTLPRAREHLVIVEAMAGMSPNKPSPPAEPSAAGSTPEPTAPAVVRKPAFRLKGPSVSEPGAGQ